METAPVWRGGIADEHRNACRHELHGHQSNLRADYHHQRSAGGCASCGHTERASEYFGDYHLDAFAVESYSDTGSGGSLLAHGTIGNVVLVVPPPPITFLQPTLVNGVGQVQFASELNWNYVLQSSSDLQNWSAAGTLIPGTGGNLSLQDTNSVQHQQFYRVNAVRAD